MAKPYLIINHTHLDMWLKALLNEETLEYNLFIYFYSCMQSGRQTKGHYLRITAFVKGHLCMKEVEAHIPVNHTVQPALFSQIKVVLPEVNSERSAP